jgi:hypothetical protein
MERKGRVDPKFANLAKDLDYCDPNYMTSQDHNNRLAKVRANERMSSGADVADIETEKDMLQESAIRHTIMQQGLNELMDREEQDEFWCQQGEQHAAETKEMKLKEKAQERARVRQEWRTIRYADILKRAREQYPWLVGQFTTKKKTGKDDIDKILQLADALPRFKGGVETNHWLERQLQILYEKYTLKERMAAEAYNKHFRISPAEEERMRVEATPEGQHWLRSGLIKKRKMEHEDALQRIRNDESRK